MNEKNEVSNNELALRESPMAIALSPKDVLEQVQLIQRIMRDVMKDGEHYGVIPGCGTKPSLLKAGAEKISFTFRLSPHYQIEERDMAKGHREYRVICELRTPGGHSAGQGVGACSTMEGKYRFRPGPRTPTGKAVPREYWNMRNTDPKKARELIGGVGFQVHKEGGVWEIVQEGEKIEHDNPADYYNTVLKMAKKRAHVDAVLTATAASDIFTQDVEDLAEAKGKHEAEEPAEQPKPARKTQADKEADFKRSMDEEAAQDNPREKDATPIPNAEEEWAQVECTYGRSDGDIRGRTLGWIAHFKPKVMDSLYAKFVDPQEIKTLKTSDGPLRQGLIDWNTWRLAEEHNKERMVTQMQRELQTDEIPF